MQTQASIENYNTNFGVYSFPFGMLMPNRNGGEDFRYGFQGQEMDNEVSGNGNSYTTQFRQYDPRLGRWKSLDPLMHQFPWMSPYVAFNNNPVYYTDIYGLSANGPGDPPAQNTDENGNSVDWKTGDKWSGINNNGEVVDYRRSYVRNGEGDLVEGWKASVNEEKTKKMYANAVTVVGKKDYRTSGDVASSDGSIISPPNDNSVIPSNLDIGIFTAGVTTELKALPIAGAVIAIASLDPNDPNPFSLLPLPDFGPKWDNEIKEHAKRGASNSWDIMTIYSQRYNTQEHTSVIFVYAAQDVHESLSHKVPTTTVYKTVEEAEAALGFKPRVVYYKFIDNKTKSLEVNVYNKVIFK